MNFAIVDNDGEKRARRSRAAREKLLLIKRMNCDSIKSDGEKQKSFSSASANNINFNKIEASFFI